MAFHSTEPILNSILVFVVIKPISTSAGGLSTGSTGLETCLSAKKNCVNSVYFYSVSHKKPRKPVTSDTVDSSISPLSMNHLVGTGVKSVVFWSNKVGSIASSVSGLSDVKNMKNTVAEEMSYADLDASVEYKNIDDTTLRKT
ncbi:hypothetical protein G9A89_018959 [Geosiphon pyriformis]|nr:hypothetical protein G9A89_018959 [Geosiphon pyriformis]